MAKTSYYAVKNGKNPGVYTTWSDCEAQVKGFPGAMYKKFGTKDEAEEYVSGKQADSSERSEPVSQPESDAREGSFEADKEKAREYLKWMWNKDLISNRMYEMVFNHIETCSLRKELGHPSSHVSVYVDGSFNADTDEYGYGVYMDDGVNKQILYGHDMQREGGRNVEGEVAASRAALDMLSKNSKYNNVVLYHDYQGIGSWADKEWKANKTYTKEYAEFVQGLRDKGMNITFKHVDGHTGVEGNEYVDVIAKMACGVPVSEKDKRFLSNLSNAHGYNQLMNHADNIADSKDELASIGVTEDYGLF